MELSQLQEGLPERFRPTVAYLISMLPKILADNWPLVPNHTDLLENNIHVNNEMDRIAGIWDWKDAAISPFGMSLGGLETMLGKYDKGWVWCYYPNQLFRGETMNYKDMGNVGHLSSGVVRLLE